MVTDLSNGENQSRLPSACAYDKKRVVQERYEAIFNAIQEGVFAIDETCRITYLNPSAEKMEGFELRNVAGKHLSEVYTTHDWRQSRLVETVRSGRPMLNVHSTYPTATKFRSIISNNYPLFENNKLIGAVCIYQEFDQYRKRAEEITPLQTDYGHAVSSNGSHELQAKSTSFADIIGRSDTLINAIAMAKHAANTDSSVLVYGETGTGKDLFARCIHNTSRRSKGPFLAINCAAIPENLLEGILFGTSKGVYTGAIDKAGLFEQASGGTIFLDEINSMPVVLQSKLMRVLQEKKIRRLGHREEQAVDVRIISSCNQEPNEAILQQRLRDDLFYRLAVVYLLIPPLRKRSEDILPLVDHFLGEYNRWLGKSVNSLHHEVSAAFLTYRWPGNIRQLKHCIESAMNIAGAGCKMIQPYHIPTYLGLFADARALRSDESRPSLPGEIATDDTLSVLNDDDIINKLQNEEKQIIIRTMQIHKGNITKTARQLGISRQRLQYRLKKYNLKNLSPWLNYTSIINSQKLPKANIQ